MASITSKQDIVIVGGGHNGLVAAAYLALAGRRVLVLERRDELGGAAVSEVAFPGVDARLSRYSYLVSLLPRTIADELGLSLRLVRRRVSSYTPDPRVGGAHGLLVDGGDAAATRASFARVTGGRGALAAWERLYARTGARGAAALPHADRAAAVARRVARAGRRRRRVAAAVRGAAGRDARAPSSRMTWSRGVVLTDGLIGTFAGAHDADLRQNRCFLYHVIGGGTGDWDVPVGGMGAVTRRAGRGRAGGGRGAGARRGGPRARRRTRVVAWRDAGGAERAVAAEHVLVNAAPAELDRLLGRDPAGPPPEGAQLKVNLLLSRLPRLRDASVAPEQAFAGTFHVNETAAQLAGRLRRGRGREDPDAAAVRERTATR